LALSVLAAAGCGPRDDAPREIEQTQSPNAERDAALAAEQFAQLGPPASADVRALYTGEFQASGGLDAVGSGEGAWELRLLDDYGLFTRPGLGQDGGAPGERQFRQGGMQVTMGPVTVTIRADECPLPNGEALAYTAHVLFEGVAYQGCARRGVDDGARPTWASVLPDLLPAIDACLTRVAARPARVTTASLIDEGMVSVRIRENDGSRRECIAAQDGASVLAYEPVSDLDRRTGEGDPEFQRVGGSPPAAERCRTVEDAHGLDNEVIGWLVRRSC
jgi:hypothetical protein